MEERKKEAATLQLVELKVIEAQEKFDMSEELTWCSLMSPCGIGLMTL